RLKVRARHLAENRQGAAAPYGSAPAALAARRASPGARFVEVDLKEIKYRALWRLTHIPDRCKIVGLTATLIIDVVEQAPSVLNLFLPVDRQFSSEDRLDKMSLQQVEAKTRGMISYVRALDAGA